MADAFRINDYLPISFSNQEEQKYIRFLWDSFEFNYENEKYEFANLAFHLLYMSFACFSVWQIRAARPSDFAKAMVGFQKDVENKLTNADTPFKFFENLKESSMFRFAKLIGCTNDQVGEFSKFVKQRNRIAHPSGTVFFNDQEDADAQIESIIAEIDHIQGHMKPIIHDCLRNFLTQNQDAEQWEFSTSSDQIREVLIHANYFSQQDFKACADLDIAELSGEAGFEQIQALFEQIKQEQIEIDD